MADDPENANGGASKRRTSDADERDDGEILSLISADRGYGPHGDTGAVVYPPCELVACYRLDRKMLWAAASKDLESGAPEAAAMSAAEAREGHLPRRMHWATTLFRDSHRSSTFVQVPRECPSKDLEEFLPNADLFAFPSNIRIGITEMEITEAIKRKDSRLAAKLKKRAVQPHQHSFAATLGDGQQVFGHCYTVKIPFPREEREALVAQEAPIENDYPSAASAAADAATGAVCPHCGKSEGLGATTRFCGICGAEVSLSPQAQARIAAQATRAKKERRRMRRWLRMLGASFEKYYKLFEKNGYDTLDKMMHLKEEELQDMGIKTAYRRRMLEGFEQLKNPLPTLHPGIKVPEKLYEPLCICVITRLPFHATLSRTIRKYMESAEPVPALPQLSHGASKAEAASFDSLHRAQTHRWAKARARHLFIMLNSKTPIPRRLARPRSMDLSLVDVLRKLRPAFPHVLGRNYLDTETVYPLGRSITPRRSQSKSKRNHRSIVDEENPLLPLLDVDMSILFRRLDPRNVIRLIRAIMTAQRVVIMSDDVSELMPVIETLCGLMYPFDLHTIQLMHVVPSLIARSSDGMLFSMPFQFVMGLEKETLKYVDHKIPQDVIRVDLVSNTVWQGNESEYPSLPTSLMLKLYDAFHRYGGFVGGLNWSLTLRMIKKTEEHDRRRKERHGLNGSSGVADSASITVSSTMPPGVGVGVGLDGNIVEKKKEDSLKRNEIINSRAHVASNQMTMRVAHLSAGSTGSLNSESLDAILNTMSMAPQARGSVSASVQRQQQRIHLQEDIVIQKLIDLERKLVGGDIVDNAILKAASGEARSKGSSQAIRKMDYRREALRGLSPPDMAPDISDAHKILAIQRFQKILAQRGDPDHMRRTKEMALLLFSSAEKLSEAVGSQSGGVAGMHTMAGAPVGQTDGMGVAVTQRSMEHASGGDAFVEYRSDVCPFELGTFDAQRLRQKTLSLMFSLFRTYGRFMQNSEGNVVAGRRAAAVADSSMNDRDFDRNGFLADSTREEAPFLECVVGTGNDSGTQMWSVFVQEREKMLVDRQDAFALGSLRLMRTHVQELTFCSSAPHQDHCWILPPKFQKEMTKMANGSSKQVKTSSRSTNGRSRKKRVPNEDKSSSEWVVVDAGGATASSRLRVASDKSADLYYQRNKQFMANWVLMNVRLRGNVIEAFEVPEQGRRASKKPLAKVSIVRGKLGTESTSSTIKGTELRVPETDRKRGRVYKTPYVFEIVNPDGSLFTVCCTDRDRRRLWLRFLDARRRVHDLNELSKAYIPQGQGDLCFGGQHSARVRKIQGYASAFDTWAKVNVPLLTSGEVVVEEPEAPKRRPSIFGKLMSKFRPKTGR